MNAVELREVSFSYEAAGDTPALRNVSLRVPAGQCVVLTGPSGCGKTTVTRLVNGLIPVSYAGELAGSVCVSGREMTEWSMDDLCREVGSVFQNPRSQFFNLDTTSEVAFGCENLGLSRDEMHERVAEAFSMLGIVDLRDRDIQALSGGQRQMIALGAACALGPQVFVLDEPTASLDVTAMKRLAQVVRRLKELGRTVIVAEHRLWWLAGIADRVVVMGEGRVVLDASAEEFKNVSEDRRRELGLRSWDLSDGVSAGCGAVSLDPACAGREALGLDASGIVAGYARCEPVLSGADLRVPAGCVVALVGRNGAGKTTLSRCLVGLHKERAGRVRFFGEEPKRQRRPECAYLVMQETGYQLFSDSVRGELEGALTHGGLDKRRAADEVEQAVDQALERFDLAAFANRHPLSLSGGQRQRLAIAAGLLQGARVLVLDEPTSGLDYANMMRVAAEVRRARDEGACVVVITHDYEFICAACDQAAVVRDGSVSDLMPVRAETLPYIREALGVDESTSRTC